MITCITPSFHFPFEAQHLLTGESVQLPHRHASEVALHVADNFFLCLEKLLTHITLKLPESRVPEDVYVELRLGAESLPTLFTLMIFYTSVCKNVCGAGTLLAEFLATHLTFIVPFMLL